MNNIFPTLPVPPSCVWVRRLRTPGRSQWPQPSGFVALTKHTSPARRECRVVARNSTYRQRVCQAPSQTAPKDPGDSDIFLRIDPRPPLRPCSRATYGAIRAADIFDNGLRKSDECYGTRET